VAPRPIPDDGITPLDLTEDETLALSALLTSTADEDRYPLSRIRALRGILAFRLVLVVQILP
jgi:hypothetical protein